MAYGTVPRCMYPHATAHATMATSPRYHALVGGPTPYRQERSGAMSSYTRTQRPVSRRGLLALRAGAAGTTALAACTRSDGTGGGRTPLALAPARLGAYISGTAGTYRLMQEPLFPAFSEGHPGVTVELTPGLLDLTKLRTL